LYVIAVDGSFFSFIIITIISIISVGTFVTSDRGQQP